MDIIQFVFAFLYTRNWHTGQLELSRPRVALFCLMLFIIMLGVLIISILQSPVKYESKSLLLP